MAILLSIQEYPLPFFLSKTDSVCCLKFPWHPSMSACNISNYALCIDSLPLGDICFGVLKAVLSVITNCCDLFLPVFMCDGNMFSICGFLILS